MPTYNNALSTYISQNFAHEDDVLIRIRQGIAENGLPQISIKPEEGRFLQFLVAANGSKLALEIGTLGGYSGTWIARGLADGGKLITIEKEASHVAIAREHFRLAQVSDRVEVIEGDALGLLRSMTEEGPFDFIFIDAEKESYPKFLEWAINNLNLGGIVTAHNAFLRGDVIEGSDRVERVAALRAFNNQLASDPRFVSTIFPAGDGLAFGLLRE